MITAAAIPPLFAALVLGCATGPAGLLLFLSNVFGAAFFWREYGLFTFGPVTLLAAIVYAREMRYSRASRGPRPLPQHPPQ